MYWSKIKQFFYVWRDCFRSLSEVRIFVPFLVFAIIQLGGLFVLLNFYRYPINNLLVPVFKLVAGENYLHYPDSFMVMPLLFSYTNIILSGLIGTVIIGISTLLFAGKYQKKKITFSLSVKKVFPKYLILFVLWILESITVFAVMLGLPALCQNLFILEYIEIRYLEFACFFSGLFVAAIFAYTTAAVVLGNQGIKKSFLASYKIFGKHIIATFLLVLIPNIANLPFNYASGKTLLVLQRFNPEMIFVLISFTIIVSVVTNFFLVGTVTRYYMVQQKY